MSDRYKCFGCGENVCIARGMWDEEQHGYWHRSCFLLSIKVRKDKFVEMDGKAYIKRLERMQRKRELTY